jgi:hypothetical protein
MTASMVRTMEQAVEKVTFHISRHVVSAQISASCASRTEIRGPFSETIVPPKTTECLLRII